MNEMIVVVHFRVIKNFKDLEKDYRIVNYNNYEKMKVQEINWNIKKIIVEVFMDLIL